MITVMDIESSLCFTLIISLKHLCDIHTINDLRSTDLHPEELDLHPVSDEETGTLEVKPHARCRRAASCVLNQIPCSSPRCAREPPPRWGWSGPWPLQADVGTESWHPPPASRLRPAAPGVTGSRVRRCRCPGCATPAGRGQQGALSRHGRLDHGSRRTEMLLERKTPPAPSQPAFLLRGSFPRQSSRPQLLATSQGQEEPLCGGLRGDFTGAAVG